MPSNGDLSQNDDLTTCQKTLPSLSSAWFNGLLRQHVDFFGANHVFYQWFSDPFQDCVSSIGIPPSVMGPHAVESLKDQHCVVKRLADTLSIVDLLWLTSNCVVLQASSARGLENLAASVKQVFRTRGFECHGTARREAVLNVLERDSLFGEGKSIQLFNRSDSILSDDIVSDDED